MEKRGRTHLFAVRCRTPDLHKRLVQAAAEDGRTIEQELEYLLEARAQLHTLIPDHPLGLPPMLTRQGVPI